MKLNNNHSSQKPVNQLVLNNSSGSKYEKRPLKKEIIQLKNSVIMWLKSLNVDELRSVCCIEKQPWIIDLILKMVNALQKSDMNRFLFRTEVSFETVKEFDTLSKIVDIMFFFKDSGENIKHHQLDIHCRQNQIIDSHFSSNFLDQILLVSVKEFADSIILSDKLLVKGNELFSLFDHFSKGKCFLEEMITIESIVEESWNHHFPGWFNHSEIFSIGKFVIACIERNVLMKWRVRNMQDHLAHSNYPWEEIQPILKNWSDQKYTTQNSFLGYLQRRVGDIGGWVDLSRSGETKKKWSNSLNRKQRVFSMINKFNINPIFNEQISAECTKAITNQEFNKALLKEVISPQLKNVFKFKNFLLFSSSQKLISLFYDKKIQILEDLETFGVQKKRKRKRKRKKSKKTLKEDEEGSEKAEDSKKTEDKKSKKISDFSTNYELKNSEEKNKEKELTVETKKTSQYVLSLKTNISSVKLVHNSTEGQKKLTKKERKKQLKKQRKKKEKMKLKYRQGFKEAKHNAPNKLSQSNVTGNCKLTGKVKGHKIKVLNFDAFMNQNRHPFPNQQFFKKPSHSRASSLIFERTSQFIKATPRRSKTISNSFSKLHFSLKPISIEKLKQDKEIMNQCKFLVKLSNMKKVLKNETKQIKKKQEPPKTQENENRQNHQVIETLPEPKKKKKKTHRFKLRKVKKGQNEPKLNRKKLSRKQQQYESFDKKSSLNKYKVNYHSKQSPTKYGNDDIEYLYEKKSDAYKTQSPTKQSASPTKLRNSSSKELNMFINSFLKRINNISASVEEERQIVKERISKIMELSFTKSQPGPRLKAYGSWKTGLLIPSSDIDLQIGGIKKIVNRMEVVQILDSLFHNIRAFPWAKGKAIFRAQIPVLKLEVNPYLEFDPNCTIPYLDKEFVERVNRLSHKESTKTISVDITVEIPNISSTDTTQYICDCLEKNKYLSPLVILLKYYLSQKNLTDPYSGGLSSYGTSLLVLAWLKTTSRSQERGEPSLFSLFKQMVKFYGSEFDPRKTGIMFQPNFFNYQYQSMPHILKWPFFDKSSLMMLMPFNGAHKDVLLVIDPTIHSYKNVTFNAFNFHTIQEHLKVLGMKLDHIQGLSEEGKATKNSLFDAIN